MQTVGTINILYNYNTQYCQGWPSVDSLHFLSCDHTKDRCPIGRVPLTLYNLQLQQFKAHTGLFFFALNEYEHTIQFAKVTPVQEELRLAARSYCI